MAYTIQDIATALNVSAFGAVDRLVSRATEPALAGHDDLALAMSPAYLDSLIDSDAMSAVVWEGCDWQALGLEAVIIAPRARLAMAGLTQMMDDSGNAPVGVHPTAVIDPSAQIGADASIGPFVVIGADCTVGRNAVIGAHVSLGHSVQIGDDALIHAGVRITARVVIGDRFIAQPGAVIGGDGFSFVTSEPSSAEQIRGNHEGKDIVVPEDPTLHRIHSLGSVVIGDDVEIGSNSCVDGGTVRPTHIGNGTKIDNLVQIGHNVVLGEHCLICGHTGIAGSVVVGDRSVLGGRTAVADNLNIGADVVTGISTSVMSNVPNGRFMLGYPATRMDANIESYKALRRLPRLMRDFAKLRERVSKIDPNG